METKNLYKSFDITIDDNKYLEKFFRQNTQLKDLILENIYNKLPEFIEFKPHKIKNAHHLKRNKEHIKEYKIVVKNNNFRCAYTQNGEKIHIIYISSTTIKRDFVNLLANTTLVD